MSNLAIPLTDASEKVIQQLIKTGVDQHIKDGVEVVVNDSPKRGWLEVIYANGFVQIKSGKPRTFSDEETKAIIAEMKEQTYGEGYSAWVKVKTIRAVDYLREASFEIIKGLVDDSITSRSEWASFEEDENLDKALHKVLALTETHPDNYYNAMDTLKKEIRDLIAFIEDDLDTIMGVENTWDIWDCRIRQSWLIMSKGPDYRVWDWERRMALTAEGSEEPWGRQDE